MLRRRRVGRLGVTGTAKVERGCEGDIAIGGIQLVELTARLSFHIETVQHTTVVDLVFSCFKTSKGARGKPCFNIIATAAEPR